MITWWDDFSRERQNRLLILLAICVVVLAATYLWQWDNIHEPRSKTEQDPGRYERIVRCC